MDLPRVGWNFQHCSLHVHCHSLLNSFCTSAPGDYSQIEAQLNFGAMTNRSCVSIPIVDDGDLEPPENFTAVITTPDTDVIIIPDTSTIIVGDSDGKSPLIDPSIHLVIAESFL